MIPNKHKHQKTYDKLFRTEKLLLKQGRYRNLIAIIVCLIACILFTLAFLIQNYRKNDVCFVRNYVPLNSVYNSIFKRTTELIILPKNDTHFYDSIPLKQRYSGGTAWIIDYEHQYHWYGYARYPLTFYYATNVHVARRLNNLNYCNVWCKTRKIDKAGNVVNEQRVAVESSEVVYDGRNFIKKQHLPMTSCLFYRHFDGTVTKISYNKSQFQENDNIPSLGLLDPVGKLWGNEKNVQFGTFIDFAVLRIKFFNEKDAREVTHNFASEKGNTTVFFPMTKNIREELTANRWFIGGYPGSLWSINEIYDPRRPKSSWSYSGQNIIQSETYNATHNYGSIWRNQVFCWKQHGNFYVNYGIGGQFEKSGLSSGSSGSGVFDARGRICGIHYASATIQKISVGVMLINNAYYFSKASNYGYTTLTQTIVPYNLIYRNNFSTSFEESLKKKRPHVITNLFPKTNSRII